MQALPYTLLQTCHAREDTRDNALGRSKNDNLRPNSSHQTPVWQVGKNNQDKRDMRQEIYFAGGCFWGTEHYFKQIRGIMATEVGYANGNTLSPTYEQVYTDTTGFAETVHIIYDPEQVTLGLLTELFFRSIDPTSLNRQGEDIGTRYRTGIYYTSEADVPLLKEIYNRIEQAEGKPLAVELEPLKNFYKAEEYHQDYLDKNPAGYCHIPHALMLMAREANNK